MKQALSHRLVLKNLNEMVKFSQNPFQFFMENVKKHRSFMYNVRRHRDTKLVTAERRRHYLMTEGNCHNTNLFTEYLSVVKNYYL